MNNASRLLIVVFVLIPLVSASRQRGSLRAKRDLESCNCNPFNYQYDVDCCGPACDEPTSQFYVEADCHCDPCDAAGPCYSEEHCCDPCRAISRCYSEVECCDACNPHSYCFDFYATDCSGGGSAPMEGVLTVSAPLTLENPEATHLSALDTSTSSSSDFADIYNITDLDPSIYDSSAEYEIIPERPLYTASIEAVSDKRLGGRSETIGSIYPFKSTAYNASDANDKTVLVNLSGINVNNTTVLGALDGEDTEVVIYHEGYCTRVGDNVTTAVVGYCHWQYTIEDVGTFVATGPLGDPSAESTLAIEGGTGILMGATGYVSVYGVTIGSSGFPNNAASGTDPLSGVDGYWHGIELILDVEFLPQEVTTASTNSTKSTNSTNSTIAV